MAQGMKVEVEFHSTHHQSKKHQINEHKIYAQSKEKKNVEERDEKITPKKREKFLM